MINGRPYSVIVTTIAPSHKFPTMKYICLDIGFAKLYQRKLIGPAGLQVGLSPHENIIISNLMLRPGLRISEFLEIIWPDPNDEPEYDAMNSLRQKFCKLGRKIERAGIRINSYIGGTHAEGKWLEKGPRQRRGKRPKPRPTINHQ